MVSGGRRNSVTSSLTALGLHGQIRHHCRRGRLREQPSRRPDAFLIAAERLGVAPADCLVFEDTDLGIHAATAAGMAYVKVASPWSETNWRLARRGIGTGARSGTYSSIGGSRSGQGRSQVHAKWNRILGNRIFGTRQTGQSCWRLRPWSRCSLATNGRYGFHRDELQFLSDARHLDWGFVAYPPLTPFVERIGLELFGVSMVGLRLFSVLAQAAAIVVTGLMARELGGGRLAQGTAALAVALSPLPLFEGTEFQYAPSITSGGCWLPTSRCGC